MHNALIPLPYKRKCITLHGVPRLEAPCDGGRHLPWSLCKPHVISWQHNTNDYSIYYNSACILPFSQIKYCCWVVLLWWSKDQLLKNNFKNQLPNSWACVVRLKRNFQIRIIRTSCCSCYSCNEWSVPKATLHKTYVVATSQGCCN